MNLVTLLLQALVALPAPQGADAPPSGEPPRAVSHAEAELIVGADAGTQGHRLTLVDTPRRHALTLLARLGEQSYISQTTQPDPTLDLQVDQVAATRLLDRVASHVGLVVSTEARTGLRVITPPGTSPVSWEAPKKELRSSRVSMTLDEASYRDVVQLIGSLAGMTHVIADVYERQVTFHLKDVPAMVASEGLARTFGLRRVCFGRGKTGACAHAPPGSEQVTYVVKGRSTEPKPGKLKGLSQKVQLQLAGATPAGLQKLLRRVLPKLRFNAWGDLSFTDRVHPSPDGRTIYPVRKLDAVLSALAAANNMLITQRANIVTMAPRRGTAGHSPPPTIQKGEAPKRPTRISATLVMGKRAWALMDDGEVIMANHRLDRCFVTAIHADRVEVLCGQDERVVYRLGEELAPLDEPAPAADKAGDQPGAVQPLPDDDQTDGDDSLAAIFDELRLRATYVAGAVRSALVSTPEGPWICGLGDCGPVRMNWIGTRGVEFQHAGKSWALAF